MTVEIKSKPGLLAYYNSRPKEIQEYFSDLGSLVENYNLEVCLAYAFYRLELGQNMALYCGAVRVHKVDSKLAKNAVAFHHLTRKGFADLYETIYGSKLPSSAVADLKVAEQARDAVMHGKPVDEKKMRNAIASVLEFAENVNEDLHKSHGLKPFGSLQGFAGKSKQLDQSTSRFVLKGIGFSVQ